MQKFLKKEPIEANLPVGIVLRSVYTRQYVSVHKTGEDSVFSSTGVFPIPIVGQSSWSCSSQFILVKRVLEDAPEDDNTFLFSGSKILIGKAPSDVLSLGPDNASLSLVPFKHSKKISLLVEVADAKHGTQINYFDYVTLRFNDQLFLSVSPDTGAMTVSRNPATIGGNGGKPDHILFQIIKSDSSSTPQLDINGLLFPPMTNKELSKETIEILHNNDQDIEFLLLEEILTCCLGCDGELIHLLETSKGTFKTNFNFHNQNYLPILQRYAPFLEHVKTVSSISNLLLGWEFGSVINCFASVLSDYLETFHIEVLGFESLLRCQPPKLSLHSLWINLNQARTHFTFLSFVLNRLYGYQETKFVVNLYEIVSLVNSCDEVYYLAESLLRGSYAPIERAINLWVVDGILNPHSGLNFFVKDGFDSKLFNRYSLDENLVPTFLEPFASELLQLGENQFILNRLFPEETPAIVKEMEPLPSVIDDERGFAKILKSNLAMGSKKLLELFVSSLNINQKIIALTDIFLLRKGDFFSSFLDIAATDLESNFTSTKKLQNHLDLTIKISSCSSSDSFMDELTVGMSHYQLQDLTRLFDGSWVKHEKELTPEEIDRATGTSKDPKDASSSIGSSLHVDECLKIFTLSINPKYPLNQVLTKRTLLKYQMILRLLAQFKSIEKKLTEIWQDQMLTNQFGNLRHKAKENFTMSQFTSKRMMDFCRNTICYMTYEVIEPHRVKFMKEMENVCSVQDLMAKHDLYVSSCLKECLLTESELFRSLAKLMSLCSLFAKHSLQFSLYAGAVTTVDKLLRPQEKDEAVGHFERLIEDDEYIAMVEQFSNHFNKNLFQFLNDLRRSQKKQEHHITNLLTRLDFNMFYSKYYNSPFCSVEVSD